MFAHARLLRPDRLVGAVIGDEGPGSLLALLRDKHWVNTLSAGLGGEGRDNPIFEIQMELTVAGNLKPCCCMCSLIAAAFRGCGMAACGQASFRRGLLFIGVHCVANCGCQIARVEREGVPKYVFNQLHKQDTNEFQFAWRSADVFNAAMVRGEATWPTLKACWQATASGMVEEKLQTFPRVSNIIQKFDPKACRALLQFLVVALHRDEYLRRLS